MNFIENSIMDLQDIKLSKYDICTFLGTISIFDDIELILRSLMKLTKNDGVM